MGPGPVLPVLRYSDIVDVLARANDTEFGLGGSFWSSVRDRAFAVAARIDAGTVWVNKDLDLRPDIPYAGRNTPASASNWAWKGSKSSPRRPSSTWPNRDFAGGPSS
jgi:acyl-CoA reductase-like NAD-dependent aldehyde dehydrogenase